MKKDEEGIVKESTVENEKEETNINENETQNKQVIKSNEEEIKDNKNTEKSNSESKDVKEEKKVKNKHKKESTISVKNIIIMIILIVSLLFLSTIFAILNINNSNTVNGIYIENVNISKLTKDEVLKIVNDKLNQIEEIEFKCGEYCEVLKLEDIKVTVSSKEAINNAIGLGKTNNILIDNYSILKANLFKTKFELEIDINEEKFEDTIKNLQAEIPEAIKEYSYDIKDEKLIITKGKAGKKVLKEELKKAIILNIKEQFNGNVAPINVLTKFEEPEEINIEKIYNEIYREAQNAYIIEEPFELHKEENGIDFGITMQEAKKIIEEEKETYIIPLKITKPKTGIEDLGDKLFKQTLAKYTTIYDAGVVNRAYNIALAAKTINGTILLPGETFSYNNVLGNPSKANGYKLGTAYVGGKVVDSYGGGICQVSSTLYNAALYANLEIVERYNHSYVVNYVPSGRDATVSYGGKDFKFKNTRNYPIKIISSAKNGVVSISIMGIKEEVEYEVVLSSQVLSTTPRSTVYENNNSLEEGIQKVIQKGYDGKKSIAYKILKLNGKIISKTVLSKDTYKPMSKIVQVGTKKVTIPTTTNTVVPEVTDTITNNTNI